MQVTLSFMQPPAAVRWYSVYCVSMALFKLSIGALGLYAVRNAESLASEYMPEQNLVVYGWILLLYGAVFGILNASLPYFPRTKNVWMLHFSNILLGFLYVCPSVASLPLALAWWKADVKQWFNAD